MTRTFQKLENLKDTVNLTELNWLDWLLYTYLIGYFLLLPLYIRRKKLKDKLASTKFSISYLLLLTFIVALCVRVGLDWNRYSDARRENQWLNSEVMTERSKGVSLAEQAEFNQQRILDLEQECEHASITFELRKSSHARNNFAVDRLDDAWERLESDIQIQDRPGFISLLPLPIKNTRTSRQGSHKRYKIRTNQDDRLEVVFKVLEGKKTLVDYQWRKSKNPDGPFTVAELSKENENMRFSIPPGNSTLELKVYDKRSSEKQLKGESELLELIVNDESMLLIAIENAYVLLRDYKETIAVQVDYPSKKLHTRLKDLHGGSKTGRSLRLEMYLINTIPRSDADGQVDEASAELKKQEPVK